MHKSTVRSPFWNHEPVLSFLLFSAFLQFFPNILIIIIMVNAPIILCRHRHYRVGHVTRTAFPPLDKYTYTFIYIYVAPLCAAMVFLCASVCPFDLINFEINFKNTKHDIQTILIIYVFIVSSARSIIHHIYTLHTIQTYYIGTYRDLNFIFIIVSRHTLRRKTCNCICIFFYVVAQYNIIKHKVGTVFKKKKTTYPSCLSQLL